MQKIGRAEPRALLDGGAFTLVEALPAAQYEAEHIPGAVNLPGDLTEDAARRLAPDRQATVVIDCSGPFCGRSRVAAAEFERLGYTDVRVYMGGKAGWAQAGLPLHGIRTASGGAAVRAA